MNNETYHQRSEISASMLKLMDESWRVFEASCITRLMRREPTASMELGTAVHTAALEPQRYELDYVIQPDGCNDRRTKVYKEWSETIHASQTIIKQETAATVKKCVTALRSHPMIDLALEADGSVERSCFWTCPKTEVPCKFRPDKIVPNSGIILDIKTMRQCTERQFNYDCRDYRYGLQAAHYLAGASEVYGEQEWVFIFAAVETSPPFRSRAFVLSQDVLDIERRKREDLLDCYQARVESNDWSDSREKELIEIKYPKRVMEAWI